MTKKVKETNYSMGKHSGYELIDGVYHIAPMYIDAFSKLAARADGVDQLIKSVTKHIADINNEIASEYQSLWQRLCDDLGLDKNKSYCYNHDGTIRVKEEKEERK